MYFGLKQNILRFQKEKAYSVNVFWTVGYIWPNSGVSLAKLPREGVSAYVSRWIKNGRLRIDGREREKAVVARIVRPRWCSHCRRRGGHRRARNSAYGPWFEEPRTPGDGGGEGDLGQADTTAGGRGRGGGCHGRRPGAIGRT